MKRETTHRTGRRIGLAVLLMALVPLLPMLAGCPGVVGANGGSIILTVLTPTIERDLAANQKVTIVYDASGDITSLEGIYSTDATLGSNEVSIVQGLPLGENQFFDLDLTGVPAGQTLYVGIRATNAAGSVSAYAPATVRVNGEPAPTFGAPDGTGFPLTSVIVSQGDSVNLQFNLNDPEDNVSWTLFFDVDNVDNGTVGVIERGNGNVGDVDWDTGNVPPGQYFIGIKFVDNVGNAGLEYGTGTVIVTRGPVLNVFQPAADVIIFGNESVPIEFSGRDPSGTGTIRVFFDIDQNLDNGDEGTIEDNLPDTATTLTSPWRPAAQFVPSGTYFVGATISGPAGTFTNYAPGRVSVVREPSFQLTTPAGDATFAAEEVVTIGVLSNLPGSAGSITVFYQLDADADGVGEGSEIPITASPVTADTREIPWDTTGVIAANGGVTTYRIGARLLIASTGQVIEDFSGVVTLTQLPTIVMLKPAANTVRDPAGVLNGLFEAIDPDSAENRVGVFLDVDQNPLSGNELCVLENLDDCTQLVEATDPQPFTLDLSGLPVGTYFFLFTAQDEAGITKTFYGRNFMGEIISLTILRDRITGAFYVGDIEAPDVKNRFAGAIFQGHNFQDNAGGNFLALGDMNNDGVDDFMITSIYGKPQFNNPAGFGRGEANMILGQRRDPDNPTQGPFLNRQPFDGTLFTFDVNVTGTSLLPGGTAVGVQQSDLTNSNGLTSTLLVPDMDGDGRKELVFGLSRANSFPQNPRTCTLHWHDDFNTGGVDHVRSFSCGNWTASGQFLPGGLVFVAGSELTSVDGLVLDLSRPGVAGFSGSPDLFTVDHRYADTTCSADSEDSTVGIIEQNDPSGSNPLPAGWSVAVTAYVWSTDRFPSGGNCQPSVYDIACKNRDVTFRSADTDPATGQSETFLIRACNTSFPGSLHGVQIRSITVFDENGVVQGGGERFLSSSNPNDLEEIRKSKLRGTAAWQTCGFQGQWVIGWDAAAQKGVLTDGSQIRDPNFLPETCPKVGFNCAGQDGDFKDPIECTETVNLENSLTVGFPFKDIDPSPSVVFDNFLSDPIRFSQFKNVSGFCSECADKENAQNRSGWGPGVFNTGFANGIPLVDGARVLGEVAEDRFGERMALEGNDLFVIAPGKVAPDGKVRGHGYFFRVSGRNLWDTFGPDGAPGIVGVDDNDNDIVDDPGEVQWPGSDDQDIKPYQYQVNTEPIGVAVRGPRILPVNIKPTTRLPAAPLEQISGIPDFNNDDRDDVVIAAPTDFENGGAVYIIYRRAAGLEGNFDLEKLELNRSAAERLAGVLIRGEKGSLLGSSITPVGDLNNDGFDDVALGAPGGKNAAGQTVGEVVIVLGGANLQSPGPNDVDNVSDPSTTDGPGYTVQQLVDIGFAVRIKGVRDGDQTGFNVALAGDIDGDGGDDLLIAAPSAEPFFDAGNGVLMTGLDRDGDGNADIIDTVSGPINSATDLTNAGVVYLVYGSNDFSGTVNLADIGKPNLQGAIFVGRHGDDQATANFLTGDQLGGGIEIKRGVHSRGLGGVGDVDGDGVDDFIIGAMLADPDSKADAGEAYLILGKNAAPQN